jgi:alcohol dehydrogenase class IV
MYRITNKSSLYEQAEGVQMSQLSTEHTPRVVFANGALDQLGEEIHLLHKARILLICDESASAHAARVKAELGSLIKHSVTSVVMHVPDEFSSPITAQARSLDIEDCCT